MVEEIVRQVITNVPKNAATVREHGGIPVVIKYRVRKFPERRSEDDKKARRHHKPILVHR